MQRLAWPKLPAAGRAAFDDSRASAQLARVRPSGPRAPTWSRSRRVRPSQKRLRDPRIRSMGGPKRVRASARASREGAKVYIAQRGSQYEVKMAKAGAEL